MSSLLETARRWHDGFVAALSALRSPLLLLVRLYWGWEFMVSGYHKLADVSVAARYFAGLGIPFPAFNAVLSGIVECGGGLLLLVGLAKGESVGPAPAKSSEE